MESKSIGCYPGQKAIETYLLKTHPFTNKKFFSIDQGILKVAAERFADKPIESNKIVENVRKILDENKHRDKREMIIKNISLTLLDLVNGFDPNNPKNYFPSQEKIHEFLEEALPSQYFKPELIKALSENFANTGISHDEITDVIIKTLKDNGYANDQREIEKEKIVAQALATITQALTELLISEQKSFLKP